MKLDAEENSTMATSGNANANVEGRTQQSPLASQRAREAGQAAGRFAQWFPLGAKEGFSQWVGELESRKDITNMLAVGWPLPNGYGTPRPLLHPSSAEPADAYTDWLRACVGDAFCGRFDGPAATLGRTYHDG